MENFPDFLENEIPFLMLTKEVLESYRIHRKIYDTDKSFCCEYNGDCLVLFKGDYRDGVKVKEFIDTL